jgi:hypothetical protein
MGAARPDGAAMMFLIAAVLLFGCTHGTPVKIDLGCSPEQVDAIYRAVGTLNDWYWDHTGENAAEIVGTTWADYDYLFTRESDYDNEHVIACVPEWALPGTPLDGYLGFGGEQSDVAVIGRLEGIEFESTLLHELGHFVGLDHVEDPDAVMYQYWNDTIRFTDADTEELMRTY